MRDFVALVEALDASNSTTDKIAALREHFRGASSADCAWSIYFLAGGKPRRLVPTRLLRAAAHEASGVSEWMFAECYESVGDLAETIALLLPEPAVKSDFGGLNRWMRERVLALRGLAAPQCIAALRSYWAELDARERFVFNKLITGGLRLGVSRQLALRALAEAFSLDTRVLAQRIIGYTDAAHEPGEEAFSRLIAPEGSAQSSSLPYPFFLAHSWDEARQGEVRASDWLAEWKWDGIRAQILRRGASLAIWSRGEDLLTDRFPEITAAASVELPEGCVLDGELLCWRDGDKRPLDFSVMQTRIGRQRLGAATLARAPAVFVAFDCLEHEGRDLRERTLGERRAALQQILGSRPQGSRLRLAEELPATEIADWAAWRARAREHGAEGLMIKRRDSRYGIGRSRADGAGWFKWKLDPYSVDAVLVYAQAGHGRRAGLYTDYTFAVWADEEGGERRLVPFAKAYSGLTDAEIREVDTLVRRSTVERFGPVRSVEPLLVFEIGFESIARSTRHRAGVAVRFPRILRWRRDKTVDQADSLSMLQNLINSRSG